MLRQYRHHLNKIRLCIDENHQVIRRIIHNVDKLFDNENRTIVLNPSNRPGKVRPADLDKVYNF